MFDGLFGKGWFVIVHRVAPYAVEREEFLRHCQTQGFDRRYLQRVARILLTAAIDLDAHGGLSAGRARLEAAANRVEAVRGKVGGAANAACRVEFLRVTRRWLLFIGHLRTRAPRPRPYAALLDDFQVWMADERGLSPGTVRNRRWHVDQFLRWLQARRLCVTELAPRTLDAYLQQLNAKGLSRVTIKIHTNAIRAFVRHAERRGWCGAGVADALHGPRIYREDGLPLGPSWPDVTRLIQDAASSQGPADVRDHAILLLLTVYGLRAGEVVALRLEDLDWEHDRLTVRRPKQRRSQVYPLAPIVGEAIVRYLREVRPRCGFREVFLKVLGPIGPMTSPAIWSMVATRITRLGIQAPHRGPHALRHACAAHLLQQGLSLKEIGDHLGHRSLESTRIYAKVDIQGLREVADFDLGGLA
ncbi:MAG TPA: integrase [Chromatiales bacterium]|nr:integrase [Chromatiales bacterium]